MNEPDKALFCALQLCEQCSHAGKESQSCKSDSSMKKSILVRSLNLTTFHRPAGCRTNPTLSPPPLPPDRLEEFATPLHSRQCPSLNRNSWSQGVPRTRGKLNIGFYTRMIERRSNIYPPTSVAGSEKLTFFGIRRKGRKTKFLCNVQSGNVKKPFIAPEYMENI